jgi:SAM-dependent methyltransferase
VAALAKDSGMTSPNLRKLAALRGDQNAVASILNGGMDAELGLFDDVILKMRQERAATKAPLNETTQPTTEVSNDTSAKPADSTPAAETTGQGTVDRFVFNLMAAFNETLSKMNESNLKVMAFRAQMQTAEGRAEIQRKLAGMAQTSIFAGIRSKGILDPVVEQEMAEKALYGSVSSANTGELTKNVQQDLLNNLAKTGDPFLTTNKDGDTVSYNAWFARGRNLVDRYIKAQNKRDKGTKNSEGEQEATDVENVAPQDTADNTLDPEEAFKIEQFEKMKADAIRETYDRIAQRIAKESGYDLADARLALLHYIEKIRGVKIDPVSLGWKTEEDTSRVKQNLLKAIKPKVPQIFENLGVEMRKSIASVLLAAREQGIIPSAPVIDLNNLTLESLIEASVYDEIVNGQSHKNAIAEAREKNSTSPLMPLLAKIDRKDVVAAVYSVLNNGKPFANARDITALTQSDMQKVLDSGVLPARIQETLQALVDLSGDGMAILQNSKNEGWRRWSELLGEQMGNREPVQVVFNLALDPTVTGQGLWQEGTNTVHISPFLTREKGLMESTLLHEMMHPVWDWKVTAFQRGDFSQLNEKETAALTELETLRNLVKMEADKRLSAITDPAEKAIAERNLVGADDLREFLNEAINHKPFQDFLAGLKDPDAKNKGGLLRRIVNAILRLIRGGSVAEDSILQRSFELSLDLANYTDRELPIAERNKTQIEHFKNIEAQLGRALTPDEIAREAINFEVKYPQPRIASTRAEASRLGSQGPAATELGGFLASKASMGVSDQEIFDAIKANGGITIDVWTAGQPGTGIVVAPFKETETKIPLNNFTPQDVNDFMEKFRPLLEVPGMHLGGWISDDTVYLDVSIVTDDEVTATALAEDGNQLATYNIGTGEFPSTPELLGRNSGAVSRLRAEARYQNLAGSLQQAFRRAMGGIQGADNRNVPAEGAFPELGVIEALTGEPPTQDEINRIAKSQAVSEPNYRFDNSEPVETKTGFESTDASRATRSNNQAQRGVGENSSAQTNIGRDSARNSRTDVTQGSELTGDGRSFADFFAKVTGNKDARFIPVNPYKPAIPLSRSAAEFKAARDGYRGNFDAHIATSIPGFDEVQSVVGSALLKTYGQGGADVLDIGTSEGALIKALAEKSNGAIRSVGIDPNVAMAATFRQKPQAVGAAFEFAAFGSAQDAGKLAWKEDDGSEVYTFDPKGRTFDVVHEAMVFQFISNSRNAQVARVKELMKPGGVAIFEEKFGDFADEYDASEKQKDSDWKALFFTPEQIQAKQQEVLSRGGDEIEGMTDKQVAWWEMESVLGSNFKSVVQFWSSGNFRGYAASDDAQKLREFVGNMQPTDTVFSKQNTPREVLASRKVGPEQYISSATDEVYNFPEPSEYFPNAEAVLAYVEKKFKPQVKALKSYLNDDITSREAAYVVNSTRGKHFIQYNPYTMTQNTRSEVDAIMREEMVHCATGLVLQRKGIEWQDFYEDLGESLSPQQRQRLKGVYRSTRNNMDVGAEYFRAAIQQLLYGRITEAERKTSPMKKILSLIMDFVNYFRKGEVDPVVREVYEDSVRILQKVDKKNAAQDVRFSEPVPASETLGKLWQEAAAKEGGDAFAYGEVSPEVKSFPEVLKAVFGEDSKNFPAGYYSDGNDVTADEWNKTAAENKPTEIWIKDPKNGVIVFFSDKDSAPVGVFAINSAGSKTEGSGIYQSLYAWAHNNGKIIGPDSSLSKVGQVRRTSQMLSSALRFGTTQHMRPSHEQEIKGWRYVEADSEGQYWEISNELRPGKTVENLFKNPYNRFNQEAGIAEFYEPTDGANDPDVYKSNWEGYSLTARRVSPEEAKQAWAQNTGLLAAKESQLVFERIPELKRLRISKDGYLFGPDEDYPGSTQALPAGNTDEYLGTLKAAISKADPEFAARIGPATLARALATRFSEANSTNPTLLSSDAEGSSPSGQLQLNTFSPYTNTLYSGPVGPEKVLSTIDQVLDLPERPEAVETSAFEGGKVRSIAKIFAKTLGAKNRISFGDVEGKKATAKISLAGDRVFEVLRRAAYEFPNFASWYESRLKMALQIFTELDPDVANKNNQSALLVALAVTSNGADVATQTEDAWDSYKYWKQSGRLAGAPNKRGAMRGDEVEEKLALADELAKKIGGYEKLGEFLNRKATVAELRAALQNELGLTKKEAEKITNGELVDEVVPFSLIFGAKLGSFFNNMSGDFSTITMDRWFMRTFGRTMGTQLSTIPKEVIETKKTRLGSALKEYEAELLKNAGIEDAEADPEKTAAALSQSILKQAGVREGTKDLIKISVSLADYFVAEKNRKGLSEKGHELRRAANALFKIGDGLELNEAPDGGAHRRWIRAVMADAVDKFNQQTEKPLVPAEAQALLWYYEKLIHETYGSRQKDSSPDYGSGANRLYIRERGTQSPSYQDSDGIKRRSGGGRGAAFGGDQALPATGESREETLASRPVQFQAAPLPGFNPTVYTSADRRQTTALSRVLSDPEYQGIRDALGGKQYISYTEGETIAKATEFINSPANNGDLQTAFRNAGNSPGLTAEQSVVARGLVIQRAQQAANKARAAQADSALSIQTRNNMGSLAEYYQGQADSFADDLMSQASLAGQELRAFRVLADALVPQTWVKRYKDPVVKAQKKKMENDPVFKEMLERIKIAREDAANSTTVRMQKALDIAAKRFVKDSSVEEVQAYDNFARLMASNLPVREEVMQAATEMVVVSGIETIRKAVAPGEQIDPAFLKQWENKLRAIASQQLNGIIDARLQGGKVDEAAPELTEAQKEAAQEQKIMDAWRDFSDFPIAEMVFNLARSTIVASDSPYAALVRKAQFDPAKIKRLQQAVRMSINTAEEIRKSVAERGMSVESLKLRLQEANPTLSDTELGLLADAVKAVYDSEVQRASASALQNILRTGKRDPRKLTDASTISKLLPLVNMGAFKEEEVYNTLADKFNLPTWSQETADAIEKLANEVQSLPEGSVQRGEAGQRMMLEILRANIKDSRGGQRFQHFNQIASAIWTAGVLSGPPTQAVNIAGTTASVFLEAAAEATGHFIEAKKRGASTAQAAEFYKDIARAWLFAFGKDANNVSVRAMNEAYTSLTRGASRFKAEKQEDLATLELFKHDPRLAIPGNAFMEAITTGQWRDAAPAAFDLGLGIAKTVTERAIKRDAKGAVKDYLATLKMVGRGMLAADAVNSFTASSVKQMMVKRMLMQMDGLTDAEVNRRMKEIRKGGEVSVVEAAKAQAEQEAANGDFGKTGTTEHRINKARRVEQLIEQLTYGGSVIEQGRNFAADTTFNGDPTGVIGAVMMGTFGNLNRVLGLASKPINPFPKTITNLLNRSLDYTVYGYLRARGKNWGSYAFEENSKYYKAAPEKGSPEYFAANAKATAGTIALAIFAMMLAGAVKDRREKKEPFFEIHGPGPKDPKFRSQWAQSGNKAFSLRIGQLELRYTDWPGINIPLGILGTIYDNLVYGDQEADAIDQLFTGVASVIGTTLDRNMLGGASALFDIFSKNTYEEAKQVALGKFVSSYTGGFLKPSYIRYLETIGTGGYQDARGTQGWLMSQLPFVGATGGNPALNVLGEPIKISAWDATAGRLVSMADTHPILTPLTNAGLAIPKPEAFQIYDSSSPTMVRPMEAQEFYDFTKIYGQTMRERLTPEFVSGLAEMAKNAPQGAQDVLNNIALGVRNQAQAQLAAERQITRGKKLKGP